MEVENGKDSDGKNLEAMCYFFPYICAGGFLFSFFFSFLSHFRHFIFCCFLLMNSQLLFTL